MENEATIRLSVFLGLFLVLALLEALAPRRRRRVPRRRRWFTNWAFVLIDNLTLKAVAILIPFAAAGAAIDASTKGWGLFNSLSWHSVIEIVLAILILDLAIWAQHLITHKIPFLWRIHRVHHSDTEMDVTTAIRFHPLEIAFSMALKIGLVYCLGPSALAVIVFEILLNGTAMFNHSNMRLPAAIDRVIRWVLVTPDMHRVHHSIHRDEHDSNYGFSLTLWDRLFQTYRGQPTEGHTDMTVGLEWQDERPTKLRWSLGLPFRRK